MPPKAVQVTYLTKEGKRAETPDGEKFPKISYGSLKGTFVQLQIGGKELPITIAEGVETALSLKEAGVKGNILCSLGISNIKNIDLQNREVVIAADWDGSFEKESWTAVEKAKSSLENKGNNVTLILPVKNSELTNEKVDFNDLLKKGGVELVLARVSEQVPRPVTSVLLPRETKQNQKSKESIFLSDGGEGKRKPQTKIATLGRLETKPRLEKAKGWVSAQSQPIKSNPFKTNPFDFKSRSAEGRSR